MEDLVALGWSIGLFIISFSVLLSNKDYIELYRRKNPTYLNVDYDIVNEQHMMGLGSQ